MHFSLRTLLPALAAALPALAAQAELPIIAKARAYVGDEASLNGVKSVRFIASLAVTDPAEGGKTKTVQLDAIFEKPDRQLMKMTIEDRIETTGLDGYESWQIVQSVANPTRRQLTILPPARTRRLLAEAWENLFYYRGLAERGGRIEDLGRHTVDGINCQKVAFIHRADIVFTRYFDAATGRLVRTDTEDGRVMREEGELMAQGLRFPKVVTTTSKLANGATQTVVLTIERVELNTPTPPGHFSVPRVTAP